MEAGNKTIYKRQFRVNILLVGIIGIRGCRKTCFLQKIALNKFFGKLVKTEWVT